MQQLKEIKVSLRYTSWHPWYTHGITSSLTIKFFISFVLELDN